MTGPTAIAIALAAVGALIVATTGQGTRASAVAGFAAAAVSILGLGPGALLPLAVFVLGGGALTRLGRSRKVEAGAAEANEGRRDASHVVAKVGIPALLGVAGMATHAGAALSLAYTSSLAAAFADTTGTEVGPLARGGAIAIRGFSIQRVAHGTPGGISLIGLVASVVAAAALAGSAVSSGLVSWPAAWGIATVIGLGAPLLESAVAGTALGRGLGHFGRNLMISAIAAGAALAAATAPWGRS